MLLFGLIIYDDDDDDGADVDDDEDDDDEMMMMMMMMVLMLMMFSVPGVFSSFDPDILGYGRLFGLKIPKYDAIRM